MSNNKQTAVEWLEKQFIKLESTIGVHGVMYELIEKAKEMEKQQTLRDYSHGVKDAITDINSVDCNRYYNEKYGKETNNY